MIETLNDKHSPRKRMMFAITASILVLSVCGFGYWLFWGQYTVSTDDAYVDGNTVQVMSQISGQVIAILTDETDRVKKGDVVIKLDPIDAEIALKTAEANLAVVTRQVSQYYDNVNELKANLRIKKDNLEQTKQDYERRQGLVVNKTISAEDLSHAQIALNAAQDAVTLAQQQLSAGLKLAGNTDLYHHPQVEQAIVNVRNAFLNLRRTTLYAPVSGYVAKRAVQVGQQVNPNTPLMVIVPLDQLWVEANYKESQLKNIRLGQPVNMVADAYGPQIIFTGKVLGISPGTGSTFDLLPPQNATGNWIKIVQRLPVRISLDPEQLQKHPLRIGLSMTVDIDTHQRQGEILKNLTAPKILYESIDYSSDLQDAQKFVESILKANSNNINPISP